MLPPPNRVPLPKSGTPVPPPRPSVEGAGAVARPGVWDSIKSAVASIQNGLLKTEQATHQQVSMAADRQRAGSEFLNGKASALAHHHLRPIKVPEPVSRMPVPPVKHVSPR